MKRLLTLLAAATLVFACANTQSEPKDGVTVLTEAQFLRQVYDFKATTPAFKGKRPVVVDLYADWCGPCREMGPNLEIVAGEYAGKVDFYKVNVDNAKGLSSYFKMTGIPFLLFFDKDGAIKDETGYCTVDKLKALVENNCLNR